MSTNDFLEDWVREILVDPVTKQPKAPGDFSLVNGVIDARVYLKNTHRYAEWKAGQDVYEAWEAGGDGYRNQVDAYRREIEYDRPIYEHFLIRGDVLDVGGLTGTVREFLADDARHVSIDPYIEAPFEIPKAKIEAYGCLSRRLNFIGGVAEFLPFACSPFDWVHMRSMLDHVQIQHLALKEVHRVLRPDRLMLIGLSVDGGKSGRMTFFDMAKEVVRAGLVLVGMTRYKDFHTSHPTYANLLKLIRDNGFTVDHEYWQPH